MHRPGARARPATPPAVLAGPLVALLVAVLVATGWVSGAAAAEPDPGPDGELDTVELTLFWGDGCPYCEAERRFLAELQADRPGLVVREYEVFDDPDNQERFREAARRAGVEARSVPTTFLGDRVWVGFDDTVGREIRAAVDAELAGGRAPAPRGATVEVPLVGTVDVGDRSLLTATVLIGFVDGINPCSLWVLSVLLALVLHSGSRRRVLLVGTVFLAVTAGMYGLYLVGIYGALSYAGGLTWIRRGVAVVVGTLGALQLRDALAPAEERTLGVPRRARPGLFRRMRALAVDERPLPVLLGSTAALAVAVSLLETPCTLGLPVLWTDLVSRSDVGTAGAALLTLVYLTVFLVDELIVFVVVVATMRAVRLQERHGRALKLVSSVVMLTLAVVMLVRPSLLEDLGGTLAVFAGAALLAAAAVAVDRRHRRGSGGSDTAPEASGLRG